MKQYNLNISQIRQLDGLYCLNDLHKMAGGLDKDKPHRFIKLDKTKELIKAIEQRQDQTNAQAPKTVFEKVFNSIHGGANRGIYGNRKIVYAYAIWIDPYFYDTVLEVFDRVAMVTTTYTEKIHALTRELNQMTENLSTAGRVLCIGGRVVKPDIVKQLDRLMEEQQQQLPFITINTGENLPQPPTGGQDDQPSDPSQSQDKGDQQGGNNG